MYLYTRCLCVSISNMDLLGRHMELQPSFQVSPLFLSQPPNLYGAEQCQVFNSYSLLWEESNLPSQTHFYIFCPVCFLPKIFMYVGTYIT